MSVLSRSFVLSGGLLVLSLGVVGCATKMQTGAAVGAGGGAAVGGAIGAAAGNTAAGVILGAAIGGTAGALIGNEMDKQAKELEQNIPGATVERVGEGIKITFASGLLFGFDSAELKPEARTNLQNLALSFDHYPGTNILIVGHTDSSGGSAYNQQLSEQRAQSAKAYLVLQGVSGTRVATEGLGEDEPVASNESDEGQAQNRRVEVAIYASEAMRTEAQDQAGK